MRSAVAFLLFVGLVWVLAAHAPSRPGNGDTLSCRVDADQVVFNRSRRGRAITSHGVDETFLRFRTHGSQPIRRERIVTQFLSYDRILENRVTRVQLRVNDQYIAWYETIPRDCWDCLVSPAECERPRAAAT